MGEKGQREDTKKLKKDLLKTFLIVVPIIIIISIIMATFWPVPSGGLTEVGKWVGLMGVGLAIIVWGFVRKDKGDS